jgi:hypothetical protein
MLPSNLYFLSENLVYYHLFLPFLKIINQDIQWVELGLCHLGKPLRRNFLIGGQTETPRGIRKKAVDRNILPPHPHTTVARSSRRREKEKITV